jgi:hypothetical protein
MGRRKIDRDHVESHKIHWVSNLPDELHATMFKETLVDCPKKIAGITMSRQEARKLALYGDILIPILERDGSIPQDEHFQDMLQIMGLDAFKVSDILEGIYNRIQSRSSVSA